MDMEQMKELLRSSVSFREWLECKPAGSYVGARADHLYLYTVYLREMGELRHSTMGYVDHPFVEEGLPRWLLYFTHLVRKEEKTRLLTRERVVELLQVAEVRTSV